MTNRLLACALVTTAGITTLVTHHTHKREPASAGSANLAPVLNFPTRASRGDQRLPLRSSKRVLSDVPRKGVPRPHLAGRGRPASAATDLGVQDVTEYCSTGSRNAAGHWPQLGEVATLDRSIPFGTVVHIDGLGDYRVEDRIGSGSRFDIFAGDDPGCEQRALNFGRRHLRVVVER